MKLKLAVLLMTIIPSLTFYSQWGMAKPEELKELRKRPLIIQVLEEDEWFLEHLEKKMKRAKKEDEKVEIKKKIDDHKKFVSDYNKYMNTLAKELLTTHPEVITKTEAEVKKLKRSKKYAVLYYSETGGSTRFESVFFPSINYRAIEKKKMRYVFHIVGRPYLQITKGELYLTLTMMEKHLNKMIKEGKRTSVISDMKMEQKKNSYKLQGGDVYIDESKIGRKTNLKELQEEFKEGTLKSISKEELSKRIMKKEDVIACVVFPKSIYSVKQGDSSFMVSEYAKVFMNLKTGDVYAVSLGNKEQFFHPDDFKKVTE